MASYSPASSFFNFADAKVPPSTLARALNGNGNFNEVGYMIGGYSVAPPSKKIAAYFLFAFYEQCREHSAKGPYLRRANATFVSKQLVAKYAGR